MACPDLKDCRILLRGEKDGEEYKEEYKRIKQLLHNYQ